MRLSLKNTLPFTDINGKTIYEGDTVEDLHGQRGTVHYDIRTTDPEHQWSIDFGRGSLVPIMEVGKAIIKVSTTP